MNYFTNLKSQILIIFLIFLSSIGFFINLFESSKTGPEFNTNQLEYPYIDSACKWSKLGLLSWSKEINKNFNSEISFTFYNHPSNIFCQGRPVISNLYSKKMAVESKEILPIGIGVNPNIDNLQNTGKYILFYIILLIFFNKFRLGNINSLKVPLIPLIYMFLIFIFYGYFVFPSILNGITDIFL